MLSRILAEQARAVLWHSQPALPADGTKSLRGAAASAEEWKSEDASAARRLVPKENVESSSSAVCCSGYPFGGANIKEIQLKEQ